MQSKDFIDTPVGIDPALLPDLITPAELDTPVGIDPAFLPEVGIKE